MYVTEIVFKKVKRMRVVFVWERERRNNERRIEEQEDKRRRKEVLQCTATHKCQYSTNEGQNGQQCHRCKEEAPRPRQSLIVVHKTPEWEHEHEETKRRWISDWPETKVVAWVTNMTGGHRQYGAKQWQHPCCHMQHNQRRTIYTTT